MPYETSTRTAINLIGCNASDDALAFDISQATDDQTGSISEKTFQSIKAARAALDANPLWVSVSVASDMECQTLDHALNHDPLWRTGNKEFIIYRFPGLFLRILNKDNRQAEIEFEVMRPDGTALIKPVPCNPNPQE